MERTGCVDERASSGWIDELIGDAQLIHQCWNLRSAPDEGLGADIDGSAGEIDRA